MELVAFYEQVSLKEYNSSLDTKLLFPFSRNLQDVEMVGGTDNQDKVETNLKEISRKYLKKSLRYDELYEDYQSTSQNIKQERQALESFREVVLMYEEQLNLHLVQKEEAFPHEASHLQDNLNLLRDKLEAMRRKQEDLITKLRVDNIHNRELDMEMNSLKPEIISLYKQRDQHQSWLLKHGSSVEDLSMLLEMPHNDKRNWFFPEVDQSMAEEMLQPGVHGTFLIRRSRGTTQQYSLSIKCGSKVFHCRIKTGPQGFGFAEPLVYRTLLDLVLHYAVNSLEEHQPLLTTTLTIPVGELLQK